MSTLYVTEYSRLWLDANGVGQMPQDPPIAEQTVAITASSVKSNPFNVATRFIRLHTDSVCSVEVNMAPVATATTGRMAANATEYRAVVPAAGMQVAVITNS